MSRRASPALRRAAAFAAAALLLLPGGVAPAHSYVLNRTVPAAGGCPELNRMDTLTMNKTIDRRWSTSASASIRTATGNWTAGNAEQTDEVEQSILRSFSVWTSVTGTRLTSSKFAALNRVATQSACSSDDALNTICFNQSAGFSSNVLAFTLIVTSDIPGETFGGKTSAFVGEILDADILFKPNDSSITFATPAALPSNSSSFDLESLLIHEIGHFLGFSHSGIWRAMMYPFAPPRGTFLGDRPTMQAPDGPLANDDRVGLRVLYPDPNEVVNVGSISGFITPANPLALALIPSPSPGRSVTGIFGAHVVAVDAATGSTVAGTLGGWSCNGLDPPTKFDGFYILERLPVDRSYKIYVEPFDGPVASGNIVNALSDLCRGDVPTPCMTPAVNTNFTTRVKPQ